MSAEGQASSSSGPHCAPCSGLSGWDEINLGLWITCNFIWTLSRCLKMPPGPRLAYFSLKADRIAWSKWPITYISSFLISYGIWLNGWDQSPGSHTLDCTPYGLCSGIKMSTHTLIKMLLKITTSTRGPHWASTMCWARRYVISWKVCQDSHVPILYMSKISFQILCYSKPCFKPKTN